MIIIVCLLMSFAYSGPKTWDNLQYKHQSKRTTKKSKNAYVKPLGTKEIAIIHSKDGFFPQRLFLNVQQKTKLFVTGVSGIETSFIIDELSVYKGISSGEVATISLVPKKQGVYKFYCPISNKKGWIVVK